MHTKFRSAAIDARQRARAGADVELPFWLPERMAGG